jgi:hypothetical protein
MAEKDRWPSARDFRFSNELAAAIWASVPEEIDHALANGHVYWLAVQIEKTADAAHAQRFLDTLGTLSDACRAFSALQRRRITASLAP